MARFAELMRVLWLDNRRTICANALTNAVVQSVPEFQQYGQQDAHEALSYALNNLLDRRREKRRTPKIKFAGKFKITKLIATKFSKKDAKQKFKNHAKVEISPSEN